MHANHDVMNYLRRTIAGSPKYGDQWEVISIDTEPVSPDQMWVHLDNGTTIHLTVEYEGPES